MTNKQPERHRRKTIDAARISAKRPLLPIAIRRDIQTLVAIMASQLKTRSNAKLPKSRLTSGGGESQSHSFLHVGQTTRDNGRSIGSRSGWPHDEQLSTVESLLMELTGSRSIIEAILSFGERREDRLRSLPLHFQPPPSRPPEYSKSKAGPLFFGFISSETHRDYRRRSRR